MAGTTYQAVVENGQIRLPADVVLPERGVVYVVVPGGPEMPVKKCPSVRLANPEDARKFEKVVTWDPPR